MSNRMFYEAIGNSIQENKDKIAKLEKQNANYKKAKKKLQQENKQLKDNWNKLKDYLDTYLYKITVHLYTLNAYRNIKCKMQELEGQVNEVE